MLVSVDRYPGCIYLGYDITVNIVAYLSLITKSLAEKSKPFGANCPLKDILILASPFQIL